VVDRDLGSRRGGSRKGKKGPLGPMTTYQMAAAFNRGKKKGGKRSERRRRD